MMILSTTTTTTRTKKNAKKKKKKWVFSPRRVCWMWLGTKRVASNRPRGGSTSSFLKKRARGKNAKGKKCGCVLCVRKILLSLFYHARAWIVYISFEGGKKDLKNTLTHKKISRLDLKKQVLSIGALQRFYFGV